MPQILIAENNLLFIMVLWVGWGALLLVSPRAFSWGLYSVGLLVGDVCVQLGQLEGQGLSLCVLFCPQGGLVELLYSMLLSGFKVHEANSYQASGVLGSRTCKYDLYHIIFVKASHKLSPRLICSKILWSYFFSSPNQIKSL